jgi:hypothetical protein
MKQVKVLAPAHVSEGFLAACKANGTSMTTVLTEFMAKYAGAADFSKTSKKEGIDPYGTRQKRRKAIAKLIQDVEKALDGEFCYLDNIPENLQGSVRHENAERSVEGLEAAIEALGSIYE